MNVSHFSKEVPGTQIKTHRLIEKENGKVLGIGHNPEIF